MSNIRGPRGLGVETVLEWFSRTPMWRQVVEEEEKKRRDRRAELVKKIALLRKDLEGRLPALMKNFEARKAGFDAAMANLRKAEDTLQEAYKEVHNAKVRAEREIDMAERELREIADPEIDDFRRAAIQYFDANCGRVGSPLEESRAWAAACLSVAREAEALKYQTVPDVEVRLQTLAATIPTVAGAAPFEWSAKA